MPKSRKVKETGGFGVTKDEWNLQTARRVAMTATPARANTAPAPRLTALTMPGVRSNRRAPGDPHMAADHDYLNGDNRRGEAEICTGREIGADEIWQERQIEERHLGIA